MMHIKNRNWYKCFKDELYKQPGVTYDMSVCDAARVVANKNKYIENALSYIEGGEAGIIKENTIDSEFLKKELPENEVEEAEAEFNKVYCQLYLSLIDKHFGTICLVKLNQLGFNEEQQDAINEAFLCKHSLQA